MMCHNPPPKRQILAIGGLPDDEDIRRFLDHMATLTGKTQPTLAFLPTACGDAQEKIDHLSRLTQNASFQWRTITLFRRAEPQLRTALLGADAIFVGGGNTVNMLAIWRAYGIDLILKEAYRSGVVLGGVSAGMICWFEAGMTDSFLQDSSVPLRDGLQILSGSACPHFDSESARRPSYLNACAGSFPAGVAADERCGIHYVNESIASVVATDSKAAAYLVSKETGPNQVKKMEVAPLPDL